MYITRGMIGIDVQRTHANIYVNALQAPAPFPGIKENFSDADDDMDGVTGSRDTSTDTQRSDMDADVMTTEPHGGYANATQINRLPQASGRLKSESDITKVLLITRFRGGSTFLGEAFNRNDDVFYWFEPLIVLVKSRLTARIGLHFTAFLHGDNGTIR